MNIVEQLFSDVRIKEGLNACINCGTCTAICPAAQFYDYDPRTITDTVQKKEESSIIALLKSDQIWCCGECMSCKTRCPRNNAPGLIIIALRNLSQETGYFTASEMGRQQIVVKRVLSSNMLNHGYCVHVDKMDNSDHPEQGPIWEWIRKNTSSLLKKLGASYNEEKAGTLRKITAQDMQELHNIFKVTGASKRFEFIEKCSAQKAADMGIDYSSSDECTYYQNAKNIKH